VWCAADAATCSIASRPGSAWSCTGARVGRQPAASGFRRLSAGPQQPKPEPEAQAAFKKPLRSGRRRDPGAGTGRAPGGPPQIRFQDEAGVGRQGRLTRIRARRGTRLSRAPRDTRCRRAHLSGASVWRGLPGARCCGRAGPALGQHGGDRCPPGRDRPHRRPRCRCAHHPWRRRLAPIGQPRCPGQWLPADIATLQPGTEPRPGTSGPASAPTPSP